MAKHLRAYVEGALLSALFLIFLLLANYTPLGALLVFLLPLPFTIYAARHSWRHTLLVGCFAMLLASLFGMILLFPMMIYAVAVGLALGTSFSRRHPALQTVVLGSLAVLAFTLASFLFGAFILQVDVIGEIEELLNGAIVQNREMYHSLFPGVPQEEIAGLLAGKMKDMLTSILVISSFLTGLINYGAAYVMLRRLGFSPSPFPRLSGIMFPPSLLYYYLGAILLALLSSALEDEWLDLAAMNVLPVLEIAISLQGLFFVFYFAEWKKMGKALPALACILLFIPPFQFILNLIGILDLGLNLRKKISSRG